MRADNISVIHKFTVLIFLVILSSTRSNAQTGVIIHERVSLDSKQQLSSDVNVGDVSSQDVSIVAKMEYTSGKILSIDPNPVYPCNCIGWGSQSNLFLVGGNNDAWVGVHCLTDFWDYGNVDYVELGTGGSGYSGGNYYAATTDGQLVVNVTSVSPTIDNTCVIVIPEKSTIFAGDTINLDLGIYPADQLFDVEAAGGILLAPDGMTSSYLIGVKQPIKFIAPLTNSGGGPAASSIRGNDKLKSKFNNQNIMNKRTGAILKTQSDDVDIWSCPVCNVTVLFPELVVYSLTGDDNNKFITGTDLPKMPKPVIKAQLKNYYRGEVKFNWTLTIKWKANGIDFSTPQDITEQYTGTASGQNNEIVDLEIGETLFGETDMRGGDIISLTVTATTDYAVYATDPTPTINPFVIKGENPNPSTLLAELGGDIYAAIAWKESRFNQFSTAASFIANPNSTTHEYPLYNTSYDFGLMQINHPDYYPTWLYKEGWDEYDSYFCDDIVWNWVTNVQQGKLMLNHLLNLAKSFYKNYKNAPQLDNDQQWKQAYCGYHAGEGYYYWKWMEGNPEKNKTGYWKEGDKDGTNGGRTYANDAWNIYNQKPWPKN